jgi:hypothetical protein
MVPPVPSAILESNKSTRARKRASRAVAAWAVAQGDGVAAHASEAARPTPRQANVIATATHRNH